MTTPSNRLQLALAGVSLAGALSIAAPLALPTSEVGSLGCYVKANATVSIRETTVANGRILGKLTTGNRIDSNCSTQSGSRYQACNQTSSSWVRVWYKDHRAAYIAASCLSGPHYA